MEENLQIRESLLEYLLKAHLVYGEFSPEELRKEIYRFDAFVQEPRNADLDHQEAIQDFCKLRAWTDDERKNHNIAGAVYNGWLLLLGVEGLRSLVTKRGKAGEPVYKYKCQQCGWEYSQYQYEEIQTNRRGKCPRCRRGPVKRVKARKEMWLMEQLHRRAERQPNRSALEIPVSPEQLRKFDEAWDNWEKHIVKKYKKLTTDKFVKPEDILKLSHRAKSYLQQFYKPLPVEIKLCALPECLNRIPYGSRRDRQYCSERCRSIAKARKHR